MKIVFQLGLVGCVAVLFAGCENPKYAAGERMTHMPINCATAEGDIRMLQHEKAHVADQVASGVTAVVPIGVVVGVATGTEGEKLKVGTGEYNQMIDKKIAAIKDQCGLE